MFGLTSKEIFFCIINGFLIGIANLIPGVSGGTFALILGLYDRLISGLTSINLDTLKAILKLLSSPFRKQSWEEFGKELQRIDAYFLAFVLFGVLLSVLSGAKLILYLLTYQPAPTLALFIGLIIPSLVVPYRMITERNLLTWSLVIPGLLLTIVPSFFMSNFTGSENLIYSFVCGAIAISAMILPGISGSYLLLVLGEYPLIISKLSDPFHLSSILFLGSFAIGCLFGLLAFTHVIKYLLENHRSKTMSFLLGLILGSFYILWPFKDYSLAQTIVGRSGEVKRDIQIATAPNILPGSLEEMIFPMVALVFGIFLGLFLNKIESLLSKE